MSGYASETRSTSDVKALKAEVAVKPIRTVPADPA